MPRYVEIPWLRAVPRRLGLVDASGSRHDVPWLDPGDARRDSLPARTRQELDALESRFTPATWGRYSWRVLIAIAAALLFAAAVVIPIGAYAMFPQRTIFRLVAGIIGILPFLVLVLILAGRVWARRAGAAARISACLAGGRCPACLAEIDSLTARPVETVPCACRAVWPTLGALQAGGRSIEAVTVVSRASELAWTIPLGLISTVLALGIPLIPPRNQAIGAAAAVVLVLIFAPLITRGRGEMAMRLALALGAPPLLVMLWILITRQYINTPLLVGGVVVCGVCIATRWLPVPAPPRFGWDVARFVCESCGYDLRGAGAPGAPPAVCPECGTAVRDGWPTEAAETKHATTRGE